MAVNRYAQVCKAGEDEAALEHSKGAGGSSKDVAQELGISHSTASQTLDGADSHQISPETRARVLEAARRLD